MQEVKCRKVNAGTQVLEGKCRKVSAGSGVQCGKVSAGSEVQKSEVSAAKSVVQGVKCRSEVQKSVVLS